MAEIECKEVIISKLTRRGKGIENDPIRKITQVFTKDGELIAEHDPNNLTFRDKINNKKDIWIEKQRPYSGNLVIIIDKTGKVIFHGYYNGEPIPENCKWAYICNLIRVTRDL